MGVKGKKLHRDERRAILRALLGGCSLRVAALRFGVSVSTVQRVAPPALLERLRQFVGRFRSMAAREVPTAPRPLVLPGIWPVRGSVRDIGILKKTGKRS